MRYNVSNPRKADESSKTNQTGSRPRLSQLIKNLFPAALGLTLAVLGVIPGSATEQPPACMPGAAVMAQPGGSNSTPVYSDKSAPIEQRINDLLQKLTLKEKIDIIHGDPTPGVEMDTKPITRLGIPKISTSDGPHGVRWGNSTAFPPGVSLAATWNEDLINRMGVALAEETLSKGRNTILGPCVNIHRTPLGGRNFESMSEDPFLAGRIATGYINGVQSRNAMATIKHFAVNNQETDRMTVSAEISERALREIYLPQFETAVREAKPWSIMCSYNRINGIYACENEHLLTDILKKEWGYQGFVMSDWGAVHSTIPTALNGMDLEMPSGAFTGDELLQAVKDGKVSENVIDEKVRRILRAMISTGLYDHKIDVDSDWLDTPAHRAVALDIARESVTLLKNEKGALPLDRRKIKTLAVIGPNARDARMGGGGSSSVTPFYSVSPLEGVLKQAGPVQVRYMQGCDIQLPIDIQPIPSEYLTPFGGATGERGLLADYFKGRNASGKPALSRVEKQTAFNWNYSDPAPGISQGDFTIRMKGKLTPPMTGQYQFAATGNGFTRFFINGKLKINYWPNEGAQTKTTTVQLTAGEPVDIRFEYTAGGGVATTLLGWAPPGFDNIAAAAKLAASSDAAVIFAGIDNRFEGEGRDRNNLDLPGLQDKLIQAVAAANPNTTVVLINGTPLIMEKWRNKVPAIIEAWYSGEEGGRAIAEILFGDTNPSGKLPVTLPTSYQSNPSANNYPGEKGKVNYAEDIFVGYRHYDKDNIAPAYPFGHGLSYTQFTYSGIKITPQTASAAALAGNAYDAEKASLGDGAVVDGRFATKDNLIRVTLTLKNTGSRPGKEVVQLYVGAKNPAVPRPVRELKGIRKISLDPGQSKQVAFTLDKRSFAYYSESKKAWTADPGQYEIQIGSSSRDIRLKGMLTLKQ